jgi:hypothetical protein
MRDKYRKKERAWGYIVLYENTLDKIHKTNHIKFGEHFEVDVSKGTQYYGVYLMYLREYDTNSHVYNYTRIYKSKDTHEVISDEEAQTRFPEYFI